MRASRACRRRVSHPGACRHGRGAVLYVPRKRQRRKGRCAFPLLADDTAFAQRGDVCGGVSVSSENLVAVLAEGRGGGGFRAGRVGEPDRLRHRAISANGRVIQRRHEVLGEDLRVIEHTSIGRTAAQGTRSPKISSHSRAVQAASAACTSGTSAAEWAARLRIVAQRGSLASSGRPINSHKAAKKWFECTEM